MDFEIEPYVGAGPLLLGMTRTEVRDTLATHGAPVHEAYKGRLLIDVSDSLRIHIYYGLDDRSEFVEFMGQAECDPRFQGRTFLGKAYRDAQRWFARRNPALYFDGTGLRSDLFGIALYARAARKHPSYPVESLSIFVRGYHEQP